jgi:hypothetical protein
MCFSLLRSSTGSKLAVAERNSLGKISHAATATCPDQARSIPETPSAATSAPWEIKVSCQIPLAAVSAQSVGNRPNILVLRRAGLAGAMGSRSEAKKAPLQRSTTSHQPPVTIHPTPTPTPTIPQTRMIGPIIRRCAHKAASLYMSE